MKNFLNIEEVGKLIRSAKNLAKCYRKLTGRPLGITGEVAEYEAARLLGLELAEVRQAGFDAISEDSKKFQIKGRCILSKKPGQRLGSIQLDKDWDGVIIVLLDADLEPFEIYRAWRREITDALKKPGSKARNERGALSVSKFKSIGQLIWKK